MSEGHLTDINSVNSEGFTGSEGEGKPILDPAQQALDAAVEKAVSSIIDVNPKLIGTTSKLSRPTNVLSTWENEKKETTCVFLPADIEEISENKIWQCMSVAVRELRKLTGCSFKKSTDLLTKDFYDAKILSTDPVYLYFLGLKDGILHLTQNRVPIAKTSGDYGTGYWYVIHEFLTYNKVNRMWMKGKSKSVKTVLSSKPWTSIDPIYLRFEALVRRVVHCIKADSKMCVREFIKKSPELKADKVIRRKLPWEDTKILLAEEIDCFKKMFEGAEMVYKTMINHIDNNTITLEGVLKLKDRVAATAKVLKEPTEMIEKATLIRFDVLNRQARNKREKAMLQREAITSRIAKLDGRDYCEAFHPASLDGKRFTISEKLAEALIEDREGAGDEFLIRALGICKNRADNAAFMQLVDSFTATAVAKFGNAS